MKRSRGMQNFQKVPEKNVNAVENIIEKATQKIELMKQKKLLSTPQSKTKLAFY